MARPRRRGEDSAYLSTASASLACAPLPLRAVDDGAFSCRISKWTELTTALAAFACTWFTSQPEVAASLGGYKRRRTCPSNVILKQEASTSTQLTLLWHLPSQSLHC